MAIPRNCHSLQKMGHSSPSLQSGDEWPSLCQTEVVQHLTPRARFAILGTPVRCVDEKPGPLPDEEE
jgi:hypothetical protein